METHPQSCCSDSTGYTGYSSSCLSPAGTTTSSLWVYLCLIVFLERLRQHLSIQATNLCRRLSSLTRRGTKISMISCFIYKTERQCCLDNDKRQPDSLRRLDEIRQMMCTYPRGSCIFPSRRTRACCTERHRPLDLRQ